MKNKSVFVDVAVDQGGIADTSRPTTHENPVYEVDGVLHYCVPNMPGVAAHTSTLALTTATLRYGLALARGAEEALKDPHLRCGLNTYQGGVAYKAVAESLGKPHIPYKAG